MAQIEIIEGNVTQIENLTVFNPQAINIILQNVNCQGRMGVGVALFLKQRYKNLEKPYIDRVDSLEKNERKRLLGTVLPVQVDTNTHIFNLFGQLYYGHDKRYLSYDAICTALEQTAIMIGDSSPNIEIYMPYLMGCDSAGGDWNIMNAIIENTIGKLNNKIHIVKYVREDYRRESRESYQNFKHYQNQQANSNTNKHTTTLKHAFGEALNNWNG